MILIIVMAINLLGDGVRDALDPRLRSGALTRPLPATWWSPLRRRCPRRERRRADARRAGDAVPRQGRASTARWGGVTSRWAKGECLGIIGESGSGKSVTALSVMGLVASPPGRDHRRRRLATRART
jgi:peptide/nickel transport system permease protein